MMNLEIHELVLQIPGISPQRAYEIGQQVALELERRLGSLTPHRLLDVLDIKVQVDQNQTSEQLSKAIVQSVVDRINL
jgi:hypothetical protein